MKNMPTTRFRDSFQAMTIMPKIMQSAANIGLETVMPIFLNPFSTTSVKHVHSPMYPKENICSQLLFKSIHKYLRAAYAIRSIKVYISIFILIQ